MNSMENFKIKYYITELFAGKDDAKAIRARHDLMDLCLREDHHPDDAFFPLVDYIQKQATHCNGLGNQIHYALWNVMCLFNDVKPQSSLWGNPFLSHKMPEPIYRMFHTYIDLSDNARYEVEINTGKCFHSLKTYRELLFFNKLLEFVMTKNFIGGASQFESNYLYIVHVLPFSATVIELVEDIVHQKGLFLRHTLEKLLPIIHHELHKEFHHSQSMQFNEIVQICRCNGLSLRYDHQILCNWD